MFDPAVQTLNQHCNYQTLPLQPFRSLAVLARHHVCARAVLIFHYQNFVRQSIIDLCRCCDTQQIDWLLLSNHSNFVFADVYFCPTGSTLCLESKAPISVRSLRALQSVRERSSKFCLRNKNVKTIFHQQPRYALSDLSASGSENDVSHIKKHNGSEVATRTACGHSPAG